MPFSAQPSGSTTSPNQTTQDSSANSQAAVIYPPPILAQPKVQDTNPVTQFFNYLKDHWFVLPLSALGIIGVVALAKPLKNGFKEGVNAALDKQEHSKIFDLFLDKKNNIHSTKNGKETSLYESLKNLQRENGGKSLYWILYHDADKLNLEVWNHEKPKEPSQIFQFDDKVQKSIFGIRAPERIATNRDKATIYTVKLSDIV